MSEYFRVSIRFLDGSFHGRADYGNSEWPPSPLRIFQAIVAASAARWNERRGVRHTAPALRWLERLKSPVIIAPPAKDLTVTGYRLYVPENSGDLVAKAWSRDAGANLAEYRTEKTVRPTLFKDGEAIHYLWSLSEAPAGFTEHRDELIAAVRSISRVGWGVDLVVADASVVYEEEAVALKGKRYLPGDGESDHPLRVPKPGTFDDLENRHSAFLNRLSGDAFAPVPPLAAYAITNYHPEDEPARPPRAVFALRELDDSGFCLFDTVLRGLHVAGMLRHAASAPEFLRSTGWSEEDSRRIVLGHGEVRGQEHLPVGGARLAFLPLPGVAQRGNERMFSVGGIRRVCVTAFGNIDRLAFRRFAQHFSGQQVVDGRTGKPAAFLAKQPEDDSAVRPYLQSAATWVSVTPVVLPGYDDPGKLRQRVRSAGENLSAVEKNSLFLKLDKRVESLLRKGIRQAGFSDELARCSDLEWRGAGFWPGTELAERYVVPAQHRRYRRLHVRITWRDSCGAPVRVSGPICIGGGKFSGVGLFASIPVA